ncbi:MAG: c-type cytochrome [Burkholderiaceae bacterium]|nr:c-type cytochrome [Burkholderiaceae bacterium]
MPLLPLLLIAWTLAAGPAAAAADDPPLHSMARRVLACTACHGAQGRSDGAVYLPRIAGKPAGYLYRQLLNFRDGQRRHDGMARLLAPLDDAYLRDIAEHFAALDLPYPPPEPGRASPAPLERGRQLALQGDAARRLPACVACHGQALTGRAPALPGLLGLPRSYLAAQLGAWRAGTRRATAPDCMAQLAQRLTPEDIAALSDWLAAQPIPADSRAPLPAPDAPPLPLDCGGVPR